MNFKIKMNQEKDLLLWKKNIFWFLNKNKKCWIILIILCLGSCSEQINKPENLIEIYTQDSLYVIRTILPERFDTIHSWVHFNDNRCSNLYKIRFDDSTIPIEQERGFYWDSNDSLYSRITFQHIENYECKIPENRSVENLQAYIETIIESEKIKDSELQIIEEAKLKNNNNLLMMKVRFVRQERYGDMYVEYIIFDIDSNPMTVKLECKNVNCEDFFLDINLFFETLVLKINEK